VATQATHESRCNVRLAPGVSLTFNRLINAKSAVSPIMVLKPSKVLGSSPES
jgi:hypothetical protein